MVVVLLKEKLPEDGLATGQKKRIPALKFQKISLTI
jgi:hypothetical protein